MNSGQAVSHGHYQHQRDHHHHYQHYQHHKLAVRSARPLSALCVTLSPPLVIVNIAVAVAFAVARCQRIRRFSRRSLNLQMSFACKAQRGD